MIIIEGPDGAGKTFAANKLSFLLGKEISHISPPKSSKELFGRLELMKTNRDLIYDRCDIISEPIYGKIVRGVNLLESSWLNWQPLLFEIDVLVIYCRPSNETILKTKLQSKPHKSQAHVDEVIKNINEIIIAYDKMMLKFNITYFNRDTTSIDQLCSALIGN